MAARANTATAEKAAPEVKGSAWLAAHVTEVTGKEFDAYNIRILLRKLAKDGTIERGEGRYEFKGVNDPIVKAVVKAVKSGAADAAKSERLDELKAKRTAKKAAAPAEDEAPKPTRTRRTRKAAAPKPEEAEDEDLDIDEI